MPKNNSKTSVSKRGRPKRATLPDKIREGKENDGNDKFKCPECNRLFPRSKSLKAHVRIHNGERPYICDYPKCLSAFCQSGQLRTHQRTHTREEVFACPYPDCKTRFIHTNRCCPLHPNLKLKRDGKGKVCEDNPHLSVEEVIWLRRYQAEKENPAKRIRKDSVNTFMSPGIYSSSDTNRSPGANNFPDADSSDTNSLPDANNFPDADSSDTDSSCDLEEMNIISNFIKAVKKSHSQKLQKEADESLFGFNSPGIKSSPDTNSSETNCIPDANNFPDADSSDNDSSCDLEEMNIISNFIKAVKKPHSQKLQKEADESLFGFNSPGIRSSLDTNSSETNSLPDSNSPRNLEELNTNVEHFEAKKNLHSLEIRQKEAELLQLLLYFHDTPRNFGLPL